MIGLAIHTSSPELGLALINVADGTTRSQVWPLGRDLTTYLHGCLTEFLPPYGWPDLAYVAVAQGPGGFTGTRIGVVVARTLAQQLAVPLFGVSSLTAIAQTLASGEGAAPLSEPLAVMMAAQRGEVFGAIYQPQGGGVEVLLPEALYRQADWEAQVAAWPTPCHWVKAEGGLANAVTGVLAIAHQRWQAGDRPVWETVLPFYGQHPIQQ